jgi:hypothetical protein
LFCEIRAVWGNMTIDHGSVIGGPEDDGLAIEYFTPARSRKSAQWLMRDPNLVSRFGSS